MPVINGYVQFPRSTRSRSSWVECHRDELCYFCTTNACRHVSGDRRGQGLGERFAALQGMPAFRYAHDLIDELMEKLLDIKHRMASLVAGVWLTARQEFHSQLAEAEVYIQEIICGKADELLASGFTAEARCLSGRIQDLCDLLTNAQDMANSYEAPNSYLLTVAHPEPEAAGILDGSYCEEFVADRTQM